LVGGTSFYIDWCIMFQFLLHSVSYTPVYTISVYRKITHSSPYAVMRLVTRLGIETLMPVSNIYPFSFVYHWQYFATCFVVFLCVYHTGRLCDWRSVSWTNYILREIPKTRFMDFGLPLRKQWRRIFSVKWRSHSRHLPRFACLLALFTLARIACLLHICVKTSRFHYSIWATPK